MTKGDAAVGHVDLETVSADIVLQAMVLLRSRKAYGLVLDDKRLYEEIFRELYDMVVGTLMEHDAIAQGHTSLPKERRAQIDGMLAVLKRIP